MLDLNALRVFEKVASLKSFTAAARALGLPKSNVSRAIARLEAELGSRLFQRTTRDVALTLTGEALLERSTEIIASLGEALAYVGGLAGQPRGVLKVSAGMGFAVNVLAEQLPEFMRRYPEIVIALDLETRTADLVADAVDVAVRLGPLPDSDLVAVRRDVVHLHELAGIACLVALERVDVLLDQCVDVIAEAVRDCVLQGERIGLRLDHAMHLPSVRHPGGPAVKVYAGLHTSLS